MYSKSYEKNYQIKINKQEVNLKMSIWDTPGNEHLIACPELDFSNCTACVLVYDISRGSTFNEMERVRKTVIDYNQEKEPIFYLVGNKYDKDADGERDVSKKDGRKWASDHEMVFREICALDSEHVDAVFK